MIGYEELSREDVYRVAAEAGCSHRTVERFARGDNVSQMAQRAIEGALRKLGLLVVDSGEVSRETSTESG